LAIGTAIRRTCMEEINQTKVYQPAGVCIYCGTSDGKLSKEHVIPFGLAGTWILPAASCSECAKITSEVERFCLRPMLGPFRIRLNLPTRRPNDRPDHLRLEYIRVDGSREQTSIPASEFPVSCIGFRFPAPGILRGVLPSDDFDGELVVRQVMEEVRPHIKPEGQRVKPGTINILQFARMLAKIGHSYAVAELGLGAFEPMLPALILGKPASASHLVGGDASGPVPESESCLHHVFLQNCVSSGTEYVLAAIRLFAFVGMPPYHVVVGRKKA